MDTALHVKYTDLTVCIVIFCYEGVLTVTFLVLMASQESKINICDLTEEETL